MSRPNTKQPTTTTTTSTTTPLPLETSFSPSSSSAAAPTDRYRTLLASHRQLEARLREEQRLSSWWQERVGALDRRCRDVNTELRAALDQKRALMRTVRFLKAEVGHLWRCRLVEADQCKDTSAELDAFLVAAEREMGVAKASWALDGWRGVEGQQEQQQQQQQESIARRTGEEARATGGDPAIKALIQTLWSVQGEDSIVSEKSSVCECDASRTLRALFPRSDEKARALEEEQPDPLVEMLLRRRRSKKKSRAAEEQEMRVTTPVTTDPVVPQVPAEVRTPANMQKAAAATAGARGRQVGASPATTASASPGAGTISSITASPPVTESPITPFVGEAQTPEALSRAKKEHKQALKMRLRATREKVEGIRRENGVLEELLISDRTDGARGSS